MTKPAEKITQKYRFDSYYKYCFMVIGEDEERYILDSEHCNSGDIYRFDIKACGDMECVEGVWYIDGLPFVAYIE